MDTTTQQMKDIISSTLSVATNQLPSENAAKCNENGTNPDYHCMLDQPREYKPTRHAITIMTSYIQPAICSFGILGNIMILIVLTRYRMRRNVSRPEKVVHVGLITMAMSDLLFNLTVLPRAIVAYDEIFVPAGSFKLLYNMYQTGVVTTFSLTSTWLIVITAGLRYVGVCHPFRARYLVTRTAIFTSIGVICALCVLLNLPQFWLRSMVYLYDNNGTSIGLVLIDLGPLDNDTLMGEIYAWIRAFFAIFIPGLLLIYFNTRLLMGLHASRCFNENNVVHTPATTHRESGASNRLTRTLIAVVVMFILLVYPYTLLDFFIYLVPLFDADVESVMLARSVVNTLHVSNYAFNFVLYCSMNASFRRGIRELMCWPCTEHSHSETPEPKPSSSHSTSHPLLKSETHYNTSTDGPRTEITMTTFHDIHGRFNDTDVSNTPL